MTRKPAHRRSPATGSPAAAPLLGSYDPDQARDEQGQWSATGGSIGNILVSQTSSKYELARGLKFQVKTRGGVRLGFHADMESAKSSAIAIHTANPGMGIMPAARDNVRERNRGPVSASMAGGCDMPGVEWDAEECQAVLDDPAASAEMKDAARKRMKALGEASGMQPVAASFRLAVVAASGPRVLSVRLIKTGPGENRDPDGSLWNVPANTETLASAVKTFGGARVHWHKAPDGTFNHTQNFGFAKTLTDWAGTDHDAGYLKDLKASKDGVFASLVLDPDVPEAVCKSLAAGDLGLSVECMADRSPRIENGVKYADLVRFSHYPDKQATVAIVTSPALGGNVLSLAASLAKHTPRPLAASTWRSTPMTLARAKELLASTDPAVTAEQRAEAQRVVDAAEIQASKDAAAASAKAIADELAKVKRSTAKAELESALLASKLPEESCGVIRELLAARIDRDEAVKPEEITAQITRQQKLLANSVTPRGLLGGGVEVGAGPKEKTALAIERLLMGDAPQYARDRFAQLSPNGKGVVLASREQAAGIGLGDRAWSFRKSFRDATGIDIEDVFRATGRRRHEIAASINVAAFGDVFENVLNIAGLAYQESPRYSNWRKIVKVVPISGTLKQERVVTFGYGNLPTVAEGENYNPATTPGDHGHGYTPVKRGYTEDWTIESMLNDRIGALRDIVQKMALAADRTKNDFVFDQLTVLGMPTMDYDSVALFHASSHGANLLTSALTATSLAASRLSMLKQADPSTGKRLSLTPAFLLVRDDLYETAWTILVGQLPPGSTSAVQFVRSLNLEIIPVTPTANGWDTVADWVLCADPNNGLVPTFEVGFEGGREMAEISVSDLGNIGSMFERDVVTVAVKQPYMGGSPLRHEGFQINDV